MADSITRTKEGLKDGVLYVNAHNWKALAEIVAYYADSADYVFRGHRLSLWKLESTLERLRKKSPYREDEREHVTKEHLETFKLSVRGKRGTNPPSLDDDNLWWALGQHHGLATPLLDWTESPYVALFFAFSQANEPPKDRAVWGVNWQEMEHFNRKLREEFLENYGHLAFHEIPKVPEHPTIEFFRPMTDENPRIINQAGLLSITRGDVNIEDIIAKAFQGETEKIVLLKITIPDEGRESCLHSLNRMNINHATLFPDLQGASHYCNLKFVMPNY
jgi:hypothetical protein